MLTLSQFCIGSHSMRVETDPAHQPQVTSGLPPFAWWLPVGCWLLLLPGTSPVQAEQPLLQTVRAVVDDFDRSPQIRVPEGFVVEKVASSALVQHPMMAGFDNRGRLFVAESAGLNLRAAELEEQLPNSIKMLEDTNGDGHFDKVTVFADQMTLPMGACWYRDALYVASPPHIWRLRDTTGDGIADVREKLPAKFGYNGNAASVHGCFLSPDGRIFWCDGRHGHETLDADGNVLSKRAGSYIFSSWPDGSDLQQHSGGGMDNPVEVDFTDTGDVIGTVNILYSGPRSDCLVHWLYGGAYPHYARVLGELTRTGDLLGPIHQFGHVAVSGTTRYRSGALDANFVNSMFVTIFNTGQVVRVALAPSGSTYATRQFEFLTCSDPDFHPTDILEDADGSLLLVDTGGWFRIGCPTSQIAKPEILGGIYRIRRDALPATADTVDPRGLQINWDALSDAALVRLLDDERFAVREQAIDRAALRGAALLPELQQQLSTGSRRLRENVLWTATRMRTPAAQALVRSVFNDPAESVRSIAAQSAGVTRDAAAVGLLIERLSDPAPHVRRKSLTALGQIGDATAIPALLAHAPSVADRSEEHALIFALIQINASEATTAGLVASHSATQRAALIALEQMTPTALSPEQLLAALAEGDPALLQAAIPIFERRPEWEQAVATLIEHWGTGKVTLQAPEATQLIAAFAQTSAVQEAVTKLFEQHPVDRAFVLPTLAGLAASSIKEIPATWQPAWQAWLQIDQVDWLSAALAPLRNRQHPFSGELQQLAVREELSADLRLLALEGLPASPLEAASFGFLQGVLERGTPPTHVERAIALLGRHALNVEQLQVLLPQFQTAGPLELQGLMKIAPRLTASEQQVALAERLLNARSKQTLTLQQLRDSSKTWSPAGQQALVPLLTEIEALESAQVARLDRLEPLVRNGSVSRGAQIFFGEQAKCSTCHRIGDRGGMIGPDLTAIGRIRRERDLLEAILFPSRSFAREYESYSVVLEDGRVFSGLIRNETAETLAVQQATGDPLVLRRDEIEAIVPSPISVMPQGLEANLSDEQLADLVAFLLSLTNDPQLTAPEAISQTP